MMWAAQQQGTHPMALSVNAIQSVSITPALAKAAGVDVGDRPYVCLPTGDYFAGRVLQTYRKVVQVMSDVWEDAIFADIVTDDLESISLDTHYSECVVDITPELKAAYEAHRAKIGFAAGRVTETERAVANLTPALKRGCKAMAFKGRKVAIGTEVTVFWVGNTYNKFSGRNETRAGVVLPSGEKLFVAAENLEVIPTQAEMAAYAAAQANLATAKAELEAARKPSAKPAVQVMSAETEAAIRATVPASIMVREFLRSEEGDQVADEWYEALG
jgi:hypothetical protein